ncbi:hypothetical protein [Streptomyces sp. Tue6028]|uniref:hypothetical protein n=1 Tax=Streptomyces sp. Tue6028 TaxID=2036037 RepID=UPI003EBC88F1
MTQRWDADRQRWIDDDGTGVRDGSDAAGGSGATGTPPDAQAQWWASAPTQAGTLRPDGYPPAVPPPPPPQLPQQPPQLPQQALYPFPQPPVPGPAPGGGRPPSGGADSRRLLVVIVAVAVLAGGVGGGVWALTRDDTAGRTDAGASSPAVTVTATQTAPPQETGQASGSDDTFADSAQPTVAAPAPGYSRAVDPVGYTVDVPDGWARKEERGKLAQVVTYTSPGGDRRLMLFEVKENSLAESMDKAETIWGKLNGYQFLGRESGSDWIEVTYRYDSKDNGPTHVVDHRFRAADGTLYAINASGPEGGDMTGDLTTAVNSFCPTGADCANGT